MLPCCIPCSVLLSCWLAAAEADIPRPDYPDNRTAADCSFVHPPLTAISRIGGPSRRGILLKTTVSHKHNRLPWITYRSFPDRALRRLPWLPRSCSRRLARCSKRCLAVANGLPPE